MNNTWHSVNEDSNTVVVFVHGFFSNAESCWKNKDKSLFWPDLLLQDQRFPPLSIFLGGYYTAVNSGQYGIANCADELFGHLQRDSPEGYQSALKYENIVFVCHSLGGIVTRYMLQNYQRHFECHKIGLVLMASPSLGSDYASMFKGVSGFYKNILGKQLVFNNDTLRDLDDRFKRFQDDRSDQDLVGAEAVEHLGFLNLRWLPSFKPIVVKESAARYFSTVKMMPGCDHSSIVKPSGIDHPSHNFLVDFFQQKFIKISGGRKNLSLKDEERYVAREPGVLRGALFDIYEPACENYYFSRSIDEQVKKDFSVSSLWVYGPSGTGKTSTINRLLHLEGFSKISMCFSQCDINNPRDSFVSEMIESLCLHSGEDCFGVDRTYNTLTRMIFNRLKSSGSLIIFIDEVPVNESRPEDQLLVLIEDILTSIKQLSATGYFGIIVSSLGRPSVEAVKNLSKINQYLRIREFNVWSELELEGLIHLILPFMPRQISEDIEVESLARVAKGSPRFLKTFFKNKIAQPEKDDTELVFISAQGI